MTASRVHRILTTTNSSDSLNSSSLNSGSLNSGSLNSDSPNSGSPYSSNYYSHSFNSSVEEDVCKADCVMLSTKVIKQEDALSEDGCRFKGQLCEALLSQTRLSGRSSMRAWKAARTTG